MRATEHFLAGVHCCFGVGAMRSCARAMVLLSLLRVAPGWPPPPEEISCKHLFKGGSEMTALEGDIYCYKRMPKQLVTRPEADKMCGDQATLPILDGTGKSLLLSYAAFFQLCWHGKEDKATYWLGIQKRGDKWVWDNGRVEKDMDNFGSKDTKYSVYNRDAKDKDGRPVLFGLFEAKPEGAKAHTCCQQKLNEPITKAPSTTVRTTPHYTQRRTQKDTPSKPIIYTRRPDPHQPPSTTTHKPVTTKPGGNLEPKGTAGGMSTTLLLIVVFLGGAMLVAALIVVGIYLAHSKKKKRRRHHHGRRHAEPPSTTARTNPSTSAF